MKLLVNNFIIFFSRNYANNDWDSNKLIITYILSRYGADPMPLDGGTSAIVAVLDKLLESTSPPRRSYLYQLVSCLNIVLSSVTMIDMPYRVIFLLFFVCFILIYYEYYQPYVFEHRKAMFITKYSTLIEDRLISQEQVFGVTKLKHLCRFNFQINLVNYVSWYFAKNNYSRSYSDIN